MRLLLFVILLLPSISPSADETRCQPAQGDMSGVEIAKIEIVNQNIFDTDEPEEPSTIHSVANKLHIRTKKSTILQQLLIHPGQAYNQRLVDESERKLRAKKYLHSVSIVPSQICDGKLIVVVKTTDNWTFTPSISFGRSGGINRTTYEISESNFLGTGKKIKLKSDSNEDRESQAFQYRDENLFGSIYEMSLNTADNSDGYSDSFLFGKPFFQLDSRESVFLSTFRDKKQIATYSEGNITDITGQKTDSINLVYGWSRGLQENSVRRYKLGWNSSDTRYFQVQEYPNTALPPDSIKNYPYLRFEYLEDAYIQRENFNVMGVIEDIAIGDNFTAEAGFLNRSLGSTDDGILLSANYSFGIEIDINTLAFVDFSLTSEQYSDDDDTTSVGFSGTWLHYQDFNHSYLLKAEYQAADNLLPIEYYTIGGETGLRGYPIRFQAGHRKALFSVEKRSYFNWYPLKLLKLGIALFADIGSAWRKEDSPNFIKDIGAGIRLVSTRQSDSKVLHLDFSYPLDEKDNVKSFQILIQAKSQF